MNIKKLMKFIYGFVVLVIAAIIAWNVHVSSKGYGLSDMSLANVEALARSEDMHAMQCWTTISIKGEGNLTHVTYCASCEAEEARSWSGSNGCRGN